MEENETKPGKPKTNPETHKKPRAISLTKNEYKKLKEAAAVAGLGVSAYIIKKCKLNSNQ